jgi:alpha-L-fucosidase
MNPACPYHRDIVAQFVKSFKSRGLKVGLYYCWRHPGFGDPKRCKVYPPECDPATHSLQEQNAFAKKQIAELLHNYPDVFYIWNDGLDPQVAPADEMLSFFRNTRPDVLFSANWWNWKKKGQPYADIAVTETFQFPKGNTLPGETCWKLQQKWFWKESFRPAAATDMVRELTTANSRNANFLLNVAPDKQGNLGDASITVLHEIGKRMK